MEQALRKEGPRAVGNIMLGMKLDNEEFARWTSWGCEGILGRGAVWNERTWILA